MTRPEQPGRDSDVMPHEIWPAQLASYQGTWNLDSDSEDPELQLPPSDFHVGELPWATATDKGPSHRWLGVHLYAPHYVTESFAICVPASDGMRQVLDRIQQFAPGHATAHCDIVLPLRPQRAPGTLSAIRFPSIMRGINDGCAAVAIDLTYVGGRFFAASLSKRLQYEVLADFVRPMTSAAVTDFVLFVGGRAHPWPPQAEVVLADGDVVTVVNSGDRSFPRIWPEALFHPDTTWCPMHQFSRLEVPEAACVLYRSKRYCFHSYQHYGATLVDYACDKLGINRARVITCAFPAIDLDVQGDKCHSVFAIEDLPQQASDTSRDRCDCFVMCDFRPLGFKPQAVYLHVPVLHVPSILSDFGIVLPARKRAGVKGGRLKGDLVKTDPNSTLIFFAQEPPSSSSDSDEESEQHDAPAAAPSSDLPAAMPTEGDAVAPLAAEPELRLPE